ncbi:hypothetical protein [Ensifer sp. SL37]|uniref:hypothetical protein n=1 Tax=Ensifer sp. SL37 TaxID=2995137 RepID=UPI002275073C|nr:hypothetical protein [Ensifer sp. SL37]MCY1740390.1 hypothetical protein [Ensifer sp. SL37]
MYEDFDAEKFVSRLTNGEVNEIRNNHISLFQERVQSIGDYKKYAWGEEAERELVTEILAYANPHGLNFCRSKKRRDMVHNCGGYRLVLEDDCRSIIIDGACYELSLEEVVEWLRPNRVQPVLERYVK